MIKLVRQILLVCHKLSDMIFHFLFLLLLEEQIIFLTGHTGQNFNKNVCLVTLKKQKQKVPSL